MLSASQRLRRKEVIEVLKRGHGLRSGKYISAKVFYPSGRENVTMRSVAVVSKKVARTNIARNRIRRTLYDAIRLVADSIQLTTNARPTRIIFFVRAVPKENVRNIFIADVKKILSSLVPSNR